MFARDCPSAGFAGTTDPCDASPRNRWGASGGAADNPCATAPDLTVSFSGILAIAG